MPTARVRAPRRPAAGPGTGIRIRWHNPGQRGLTLERVVGGRVVSRRELGPRAQLDLEEAAAVLARPVHDVREEIRVGFLPRVRGSSPPKVTVQALATFLREERVDIATATRVRRRIAAGREPLVPWEEVRKRL